MFVKYPEKDNQSELWYFYNRKVQKILNKIN